jgi:hypothetical protein
MSSIILSFMIFILIVFIAIFSSVVIRFIEQGKQDRSRDVTDLKSWREPRHIGRKDDVGEAKDVLNEQKK